MGSMPWIMIAIAALIVAIGIVAVVTGKPTRAENKRTGKYPEGHYTGLGMAFGIGLGIPIGAAVGNISLGPALGLPLGLVLGMAWEKQNKDKLRPLTEEEKKMKKFAVLIGVGLLVLGMVAGVAMFFLAKQ